MHQSLAEKKTEASKDTLAESLAQMKAHKVGETLTDVKGASLLYPWWRRLESVEAKTVNKMVGDVEAKER